MNAVCRACGHGPLRLVLSLGAMPLANRLRDRSQLDAPEPRYPLDLTICAHCTLVQLAESPPPSALFADYPYLSSYSDTMVGHAEEMATTLVRRLGLGNQSLVVEIGSNDGYLLQHVQRAGVPVLGIDPAGAAADAARARGVRTLEGFFSAALADDLVRQGMRADLIVANNVMAHMPDLNDVVAGIQRLLAPGGVFVLETPYVRDLMDRLEFDTIYHEHVFYYSLSALVALLSSHSLTVIDVERRAIHGGSLRVTSGNRSHGWRAPLHEWRAPLHGVPKSTVAALLAEEKAWGVRDLATYQRFAECVDRAIVDLRTFLRARKEAGRRMAAYGAAAKGATLLNALAIGDEVLDFVVDRSPLKQGRYLPGTRLPIYAPEYLLTAMPDDVLLLTWNFADEVLAQQTEYRSRGGHFIVPIPEPQVV